LDQGQARQIVLETSFSKLPEQMDWRCVSSGRALQWFRTLNSKPEFKSQFHRKKEKGKTHNVCMF
jgi:hypothetical protein